MKKIVLLTVATATVGLLISGFVPRLPLSESAADRWGAPSALAQADMPQAPQSDVLIHTPDQPVAGGFENLIPTTSPSPDLEKARDYQKKVDLLLSYLDTRTKKAGSIGQLSDTPPLIADRPITTPVISPVLTPSSSAPGIDTAARTSQDNVGELMANPQDNIIRLAVLGDSMIDTLGKDLPDLRKLLEAKYPGKTFALFNYGQGATNLDQGCNRLTETTTYLQTSYPPLLSYQPTILVLESFAYNHWSSASHDLDRQWITLAHCLDTIKKESPKTKIILAATLAPDEKTVGDGKLNWPTSVKKEWTETTRAYLQNIIRFAASEKYPLADAFSASKNPDGNGKAIYINQADHLHPSEEGKKLFSQKIVEAIENNKLIQ